ncbi:hypothetical protein HDU84_005903 [Entophlyctis sp. JEL0112]|nr:hypothetical protein HDU84_005903 [Entophlyctis sp. JEL0112]
MERLPRETLACVLRHLHPHQLLQLALASAGMLARVWPLYTDFLFARDNLRAVVARDYLATIRAKRTLNFHALPLSYHAAFLDLFEYLVNLSREGLSLRSIAHFEVSFDLHSPDRGFSRRGRRLLPAVKLAQRFGCVPLSSENALIMTVLASVAGDLNLMDASLALLGASETGSNAAFAWAAAVNRTNSIDHLLRRHCRPSAAALLTAATNGSEAVLRLLLPSHERPERHFYSTTLSCGLIAAAEHNQQGCAKLLIDCSDTDPAHNKNASLVAAVARGHPQIVSMLLSTGKCDPTGNDAQCLRVACSRGFIDIALMLLRADETLNVRQIDASVNDNICLIDAINAGAPRRIDLVRALLLRPEVNAGARDNLAIRLACASGSTMVVQDLLQRNDVDATACSNSALINASTNGHADIVQMLLEWHCTHDPIVRVDPAAQNNRALILASRHGHAQVVSRLLAMPTVNVSAENNLPLFEACSNGHIEVVRLLSLRNLTVSTHVLTRCVESACKNNHPAVLRFLAENYSTFLEVLSPRCLLDSATFGHVECVNFLLDIVPLCFHPMTLSRAAAAAAAVGNVVVVKRVAAVDAHFQMSQALVSASANGHRDVVLAILASGQKVHIPHEAVLTAKFKDIKDILRAALHKRALK